MSDYQINFNVFGAKNPDDGHWVAGLEFSVSNVMPGFGFGRVYFPSGFHAALDPAIKIFAGMQSVMGVALLFFLGLGLRTRFRLR